MTSFDYESDWKDYVFPDSESDFASPQTIKDMFSKIQLDSEVGSIGGIPIICDGRTAYANTEIEHSIIYGESGSGKSWSLIYPLITTLATGGNTSMIIADIKGELSENRNVRGYLKHKGYSCHYLDLRKFDKDCYNILEYAFGLYIRGQKDKAMAAVTSFVHALSAPYEGSKADPFWQLSAEEFVIPLFQIIFEICSNKKSYHKYVNMLSIASYCNEKGADILMTILNRHIKTKNNATEMLRSVLSNPEKTRACVLTTVSSMLRDFLIQESLLKMLSSSSFNIREMYEQKMCIFLIIPDETNAYDSLSALLIDNFYNQLVDEFSERYKSLPPKNNIAFVLDEFCNLHINGMASKISASRGRMMRFFLVCQSKTQLESVFKESAPTILGNCKNIYFLQSSCPETLEYISKMLGTTMVTHSGKAEPLMTSEKLKALKRTKEYRQAIYIRDNIKFRMNMIGFDKYEYLNQYADKAPSIRRKKQPIPSAYTPDMMLSDIDNRRVPIPFDSPNVNRSTRKSKADAAEELNRIFDTLFED